MPRYRRWVTTRYFGAFHPTRRDRWVFGDRDSGAWLHQYAWTPIIRHTPVPNTVQQSSFQMSRLSYCNT